MVIEEQDIACYSLAYTVKNIVFQQEVWMLEWLTHFQSGASWVPDYLRVAGYHNVQLDFMSISCNGLAELISLIS